MSHNNLNSNTASLSLSKRKNDLFLIIFLFVLLILVGVFIFLLSKPKKFFPMIPSGSYVGVISGLVEKDSNKELETYSFYLEKVKDKNKVFVVVLRPNFLAKIVELQEVKNEESEEVIFQPLLLSSQEDVFPVYLAGNGKNGVFQGGLFDNQGEKIKGSWRIRKIELNELDQVTPEGQGILTSKVWFEAKNKLNSVQVELAQKTNQIKELESLYLKLKNYVDDGELLRKKASERRGELDLKLSQVREQGEHLSKEVSDLVSELELLGRISKTGRVVGLARNVSARERKWYLANWSEERDTSGVDELIAKRMNVSLSELSKQEIRLRQIDGLRRQIARERERIIDLESAQQKDEVKEPEAPPKKEKKTFLDRLFG